MPIDEAYLRLCMQELRKHQYTEDGCGGYLLCRTYAPLLILSVEAGQTGRFVQ
jgi:hypothetical protein